MDQKLGSASDDALLEPVHGGHSLTTDERRSLDLSSEIEGWGSDLDPQTRPGVPRDKAPELGGERLYPADIEKQPLKMKVFKSTEHGKFPPVFGTSCPPSGISGLIRGLAYKQSEGRLSRWMGLMMADRINVVEDVARDLVQGRLPNLVKEIGLATGWKYNREAFVKRLAIGSLCVAALVVFSRSRRDR